MSERQQLTHDDRRIDRSEWKSSIALAEILDVNPRIKVPALLDDTPVSFIGMADVSEDGQWVNRGTRPLGDVRKGYSVFREEDVLFAKITPCMENGKGAQPTDLINGVGFGSTEFWVLRAGEELAPRFLYHLTQSEQLRHRAQAVMVGSAGQQRVRRDFFDHFRVQLPPLPQQRYIANILDTVDRAIRKTEEVIDKLEHIKQGLLHDLLTRGIDQNGQLRDPDKHPEQFKETELGLIPREWEVVPLKHCLSGSLLNGLYKSSDEIGSGILMVGQTAFTADDSVDFGRARRASTSIAERKKFGLRGGDILVRRVFATIDGVGRAVFVPDLSERAVFESNMIRLRTNEVIEARVLFLILQLRSVRQWVESHASQSNQASINHGTLERLPLAVPPTGEQSLILKHWNAFRDRRRTQNAVLAKAKRARSGLVEDLLCGN